MSEWTNSRSFYGKVFTSSLAMPNGWTASVTDSSESSAPFRGTQYHVQANCRFWGVQHPERFMTLAEARRVAEEFTAKMPLCDDHASSGAHCCAAWVVRDEVIAEWNRMKSEAVHE